LGAQKHFLADSGSPLFARICGTVRKTVGLAEPPRAALAPRAANTVAAPVLGSLTKKQDPAASDIDLRIAGNTINYRGLCAVLEPVAGRLGIAANATVYTRRQLAKCRQEDTALIKRVLAPPRVWLTGSGDVLAA
jgi:hypothetical protein